MKTKPAFLILAALSLFLMGAATETEPGISAPVANAVQGVVGGIALPVTITGGTSTPSIPQNSSEPVVVSIGTTPTQIFAADPTRVSGLIQNMGTAIVFLGKSSVTTSTGIGIRGGSVANDANGASAIITDGDVLFGIVAAGIVNVRVRTESN